MENKNISIKVDHLSKVFGQNHAVNDLSFEVKKGTIHGFLGPNGAGKSTTMRMIAGLLTPSQGRVLVNNLEVQSNLHDVKRSIGILLETPPLYKDMEVAEYLSFVARLNLVPKNKVQTYLNNVLEKLSISDIKTRLIGNLSKGYKQRVGIAQAIIHSPSIVILDEPTVGLDPKSVIEMRNLILELKKDHTILLSSHLLHEVGLICDEVTIIEKGKLVATGQMHEISSQFSSATIITAIVKDFNTEKLNQLKLIHNIEKVEIEKFVDDVKLKFHINSNEDIRAKIAKDLANSDMGLIEFVQKTSTLEEIFLQVTGDK